MCSARLRTWCVLADHIGCPTCSCTRRPRLPVSAWECALASSKSDAARPLVYATVLYWREREMALVESCVDSLLAQDLSTVELRVLVVDNGCGATPRVAP